MAMKALSLRQPWAELILQGRKTIETRTWRTAHRGVFGLHAAWHVDSEAAARFGMEPESLTSGALVGTAEIVEMIEFDEGLWEALRDQHLVADPLPDNRVGWRLAAPRRLLRPVPLRGLPGLFPLDETIVSQMIFADQQP